MFFKKCGICIGCTSPGSQSVIFSLGRQQNQADKRVLNFTKSQFVIASTKAVFSQKFMVLLPTIQSIALTLNESLRLLMRNLTIFLLIRNLI